MNRQTSRKRSILFRVTQQELEALKAEVAATGARSLSELARGRVLNPAGDRALVKIEASLIRIENVLTAHGVPRIPAIPRTSQTIGCAVYGCRNNCPTLPDEARVFRGSGDAKCELCDLTLREHRQFAYPSGMGHCVQACDGRYYHL